MKKTNYGAAFLIATGLGIFLGQHSRNHQIFLSNGHRLLRYFDRAHADSRSQPPGTGIDSRPQPKPVSVDELEKLALAQHSLAAVAAVKIDLNTQRLFGIQLTAAKKMSNARRIRASGKVAVNESRVYRLNVAADGFVKETSDNGVGSYVKKEQRLAVIYSPEFLSIAGGYLSANERTQGTNSKPGEAAKQGYASPQTWSDRLRNLGMSDSQINELTITRKVPEVVYINSPIDGFIVARNISAGEKFDRYTEFYRIADLSQVWILADLFASETEYFEPGMSARITLSGQSRTIHCKIANVLPEVNTSTRALQLRLEADNKDFVLRPDMIVDVELKTIGRAGLMIPTNSLLHSGPHDYVYVDVGDSSFERREVETEWRSGDWVEVRRGITKGERVVSSGAFLVDAENRLQNGVKEKQPLQVREEPATVVKDSPCGFSNNAAGGLAVDSCLDRLPQNHARYLALKRRGPHDD